MRKFLWGVATGILLVPTAALVAAALGLLVTQANVPVTAWEEAFAQLARHGYARRHAPPATNPIAPTEENLMAGMKIYKDGCAGCHGGATEASEYGASFCPRVPQFGTHPPRKPDWELFWIVKNGVRYSGMSAWDGQWGKDVSDDKMWRVVTFLSRLESLPPAVDLEWRKP
jgi:mono/diheme cytochrome c family protein